MLVYCLFEKQVIRASENHQQRMWIIETRVILDLTNKFFTAYIKGSFEIK